MKIDELIANVKDSVDAKKVYTEPYEKTGVTIIPAATVAGGTGGRHRSRREGAGG